MNNQVGIRKILNIEKRNHAVRFPKIRKLFTKTFLTTILRTGFGCENIRRCEQHVYKVLSPCQPFFTILE
jgi:hypothetical protein